MRAQKALLPIGGKPAIESLIDAYRAARLRPIIVVAHPSLLSRCAAFSDVTALKGNPDAEMIDSVAQAILALSDDVSACVIQPVDAPFTTPEMIALLKQGDPNVSRVLCHGGRAGHPILVVKRLFPEILERPRGGLRAVLAQAEVDTVEWPDPRVLADLDTQEDLLRWESAFRERLH